MLKLYQTHFHIHNKPLVTASPLDDPSFFEAVKKSEARELEKKGIIKAADKLLHTCSCIHLKQPVAAATWKYIVGRYMNTLQ